VHDCGYEQVSVKLISYLTYVYHIVLQQENTITIDIILNFTFMLPCIVIDSFLNNQPDALIIQIYCYKTLHVSGIYSAHHQDFSTVHSALVSFIQVSDDRFQAESGWNCHLHPDSAWKRSLKPA